jgi:alkylated DNA repair dioxygenase AlkB
MTLQGDLFAAEAAVPQPPGVPGLLLVPEAVEERQQTELTAHIDVAPLEPFQFGQWQGKRLTYHYGRAYDFSRHRLDEAPPLPDWLLDLREKLAPQADLPADAFPAALLIRYDPGAGIGWHRDRPQYGDVIGLSLGAPTTMRLRRRTASGFERRNVLLPPRSLYRLSGEVRWEWEHSIAPMDQTRWSITFRTLRQP